MINRYDFTKKIQWLNNSHDKFLTNRQYKHSKISFKDEDEYVNEQKKLSKAIDELVKDMTEDIQHMFNDHFHKGKIIVYDDSKLSISNETFLGAILVEGFEKEEVKELIKFFKEEYHVSIIISRFEDLSEEEKLVIQAQLEKLENE